MTSPKNWLGTLLLAGFLGMFGAHRFYVGKIGTGITMLILTLTGYGAIISGIWVLIDFIRIAFGGFRDKEKRRIVP